MQSFQVALSYTKCSKSKDN